MSVKLIQHQDLGKLEKIINKALGEGEMRFRSLTVGHGMFVAVLESAPKAQPAAKPKAKPEQKSKR